MPDPKPAWQSAPVAKDEESWRNAPAVEDAQPEWASAPAVDAPARAPRRPVREIPATPSLSDSISDFAKPVTEPIADALEWTGQASENFAPGHWAMNALGVPLRGLLTVGAAPWRKERPEDSGPIDTIGNTITRAVSNADPFGSTLAPPLDAAANLARRTFKGYDPAYAPKDGQQHRNFPDWMYGTPEKTPEFRRDIADKARIPIPFTDKDVRIIPNFFEMASAATGNPAGPGQGSAFAPDGSLKLIPALGNVADTAAEMYLLSKVDPTMQLHPTISAAGEARQAAKSQAVYSGGLKKYGTLEAANKAALIPLSEHVAAGEVGINIPEWMTPRLPTAANAAREGGATTFVPIPKKMAVLFQPLDALSSIGNKTLWGENPRAPMAIGKKMSEARSWTDTQEFIKTHYPEMMEPLLKAKVTDAQMGTIKNLKEAFDEDGLLRVHDSLREEVSKPHGDEFGADPLAQAPLQEKLPPHILAELDKLKAEHPEDAGRLMAKWAGHYNSGTEHFTPQVRNALLDISTWPVEQQAAAWAILPKFAAVPKKYREFMAERGVKIPELNAAERAKPAELFAEMDVIREKIKQLDKKIADPKTDPFDRKILESERAEHVASKLAVAEQVPLALKQANAVPTYSPGRVPRRDLSEFPEHPLLQRIGTEQIDKLQRKGRVADLDKKFADLGDVKMTTAEGEKHYGYGTGATLGDATALRESTGGLDEKGNVPLRDRAKGMWDSFLTKFGRNEVRATQGQTFFEQNPFRADIAQIEGPGFKALTNHALLRFVQDRFDMIPIKLWDRLLQTAYNGVEVPSIEPNTRPGQRDATIADLEKIWKDAGREDSFLDHVNPEVRQGLETGRVKLKDGMDKSQEPHNRAEIDFGTEPKAEPKSEPVEPHVTPKPKGWDEVDGAPAERTDGIAPELSDKIVADIMAHFGATPEVVDVVNVNGKDVPEAAAVARGDGVIQYRRQPTVAQNLHLVGHELIHDIVKNMPIEASTKLMQDVLAKLGDEAVPVFEGIKQRWGLKEPGDALTGRYSASDAPKLFGAMEELLAEHGGKLFTSPEFLRSLPDALPKALLERVVEVVQKMIDAVRHSLGLVKNPDAHAQLTQMARELIDARREMVAKAREKPTEVAPAAAEPPQGYRRMYRTDADNTLATAGPNGRHVADENLGYITSWRDKNAPNAKIYYVDVPAVDFFGKRIIDGGDANDIAPRKYITDVERTQLKPLEATRRSVSEIVAERTVPSEADAPMPPGRGTLVTQPVTAGRVVDGVPERWKPTTVDTPYQRYADAVDALNDARSRGDVALHDLEQAMDTAKANWEWNTRGDDALSVNPLSERAIADAFRRPTKREVAMNDRIAKLRRKDPRLVAEMQEAATRAADDLMPEIHEAGEYELRHMMKDSQFRVFKPDGEFVKPRRIDPSDYDLHDLTYETTPVFQHFLDSAIQERQVQARQAYRSGEGFNIEAKPEGKQHGYIHAGVVRELQKYKRLGNDPIGMSRWLDNFAPWLPWLNNMQRKASTIYSPSTISYMLGNIGGDIFRAHVDGIWDAKSRGEMGLRFLEAHNNRVMGRAGGEIPAQDFGPFGIKAGREAERFGNENGILDRSGQTHAEFENQLADGQNKPGAFGAIGRELQGAMKTAENVERMAAFAARLRAGDSLLEARFRVEKVFFDFNRKGPVVQALSASGVVPFANWHSKIIPFMAEWAIKNPGQFMLFQRVMLDRTISDDQKMEYLKTRTTIPVGFKRDATTGHVTAWVATDSGMIPGNELMHFLQETQKLGGYGWVKEKFGGIMRELGVMNDQLKEEVKNPDRRTTAEKWGDRLMPWTGGYGFAARELSKPENQNVAGVLNATVNPFQVKTMDLTQGAAISRYTAERAIADKKRDAREALLEMKQRQAVLKAKNQNLDEKAVLALAEDDPIFLRAKADVETALKGANEAGAAFKAMSRDLQRFEQRQKWIQKTP